MSFLDLLIEANTFTEILFVISLGITAFMGISYLWSEIGLVDALDAYTWEFTSMFAGMILVTIALYYIAT